MTETSSVERWRVLVVEDDETVASVHCRLVAQRDGFSVVGRAGSAKEAQHLLRLQQPDLILLDLELPGPSGVAFLRQLRSAGNTTEVIAVTAHARPDVVRTVTQLGVVDYLVKPFWPERMAEALTTFAQRARRFSRAEPLAQGDIDSLRGSGDSGGSAVPPRIRRDRLDDVRDALGDGVPMSAEEVSVQVGLARVTTRRYLEYLVSIGECTVDSVAGVPGRPRKAYMRWAAGPVGDAGPRV